MGGAGIIGAGMGMISDAFSNNQQFINQGNLMGIQRTENEKMARFNKGMALQMQKESYDQYLKSLDKNGLNRGLIYGGSGAGGQTTSTVPTGNVSGGQASANNSAVAGMAAMTQAMNMESQMELNKALANKANADADATRGVITEKGKAEIEGVGQGIKESQGRIGKMQEEIKLIKSNVDKNVQEIEQLSYNNEIARNTVEARISQAKAEAAGSWIKNNLMKSDIKVNEGQIKEIEAKIIKMAEEVKQGWKALSIQEQNSKIQKFKEELTGQYPNVVNVAGGILDQVIRGVVELIGGGSAATIRKVEE